METWAMRRYGLAGLMLAATVTASAAQSPSWTGLFSGLDIGGRQVNRQVAIVSEQEIFSPNFIQNNFPLCTLDPFPCASGAALDSTSLRVGTHLGANWQFAPRWVAGLEGDFGWGNNRATAYGFKFSLGGHPSDAFSDRSTWDASARARLGFLATPSVLVYATGGAAFLRTSWTSSCAFPSCDVPVEPAFVTTTKTMMGWTVGVGGEARLAPDSRWLVRGEYRYADFGGARYTDVRPCPIPGPATCGSEIFTNVTYDMSVVTHTITFGLSYQLY
jgi:outer membrane immunogenic protein